MDYKSGVSLILPDSLGLIENDFDEEDMVHERINQNKIVELIMAAFEDQDEPSDEDDDESLNTTDSSHHSSDEQQILNINNNNNNIGEQYIQQQNELHHQQTFFPPSTNSTSPSLITRNDRLHAFPNITNDEEISINNKNHLVHYQNTSRSSLTTSPPAFHYVPTIDITDPMQAQYLAETQNQLNKLRILCSVKDRKALQLQNLCEEFREKYEHDTRALKHQLELSERSKYDGEQRYQLLQAQYEELKTTYNQSQRTIKDAELKIQRLEASKTQLETKVSDSESLIESLHRKINVLQEFEAIARSQRDYELVLSTTREKHEQEMISLNEKLQNLQMDLQEKTTQGNELHIQLEIAHKNTEKSIFERMETINQLNEQLHDCQRKYTDLLTTTSRESHHHTELQQELTHMTNDKAKLQTKCQELETEIRTLRQRIPNHIDEVNYTISRPVNNNLDAYILDQSIITENFRLKERINEYLFKIKQLREINETLTHQIEQYQSRHNETSSSSSSSSSSNETVITTSVHMEQIRKLTTQIETLKKDNADLGEKQEYEKQELYTIIEQLREDVNEVDKTKELYIDVCQEKNAIEDTLRAKFEMELKIKFDDLHRTFEQENQLIKRKSKEDIEQLHQDIERLKIKHEKQITELNNELDRLRVNDDAKSRLIYTEQEFEQLKHDYYNLNLKQSDLSKTCVTLEDENENLSTSLEQIKREKLQLIQHYDQEIQQLTARQEQQLLSLHHQIDQKKSGDIESLQLRLDNYENVITQYEEYRVKLENNLQKLTQQRDTTRVELKLTKEMLTTKENDYHQLKIRFDQCEKHVQTHQEQFRHYENTINDLQREIKQCDLQIQESNQTRTSLIQETENEYREKLLSLDAEKCQVEQRLQEANRALDLADSHLQQEIVKIKTSLEQEYNRRYEREHKQSTSPSTHSLPISSQDIEEIKKMYRTELDRVYRENIELSQYQTKLIDAHQKQMQIMKKELDEGYNNIINEFQREQMRLQTRYDQLKQQLNDAQQTIEQLKSNLNQMKTNHSEEISKIQEEYKQEKYAYERENRSRHEHLQQRLEKLVKLLEQSNSALNQERAARARQESDYEQKVHSLQKKLADSTQHHANAIDELKRDLRQERLINQKRTAPRPISVPDFTSNGLSSKDMKSDYLTTVERLRELFTSEMIALLQLTCKMIFDVHHRVTLAPCIANLDISMKKQIDHELIRSRNSMIKEIRREIFEKMTYALKSQGMPDISIDIHIFELDRLLSQMVQDCLNSLPEVPSSSFHSSLSSLPITSQRPETRPVISKSSSTSSPRKSIECLYMTPSVNKKPAPVAPHCDSTLDDTHQLKSASNSFLTNQHSFSVAQKRQQSINKTPRMRIHRSEDDIVRAVQSQHEQKRYFDNDDTLILSEDPFELEESNLSVLIKQVEQPPIKYATPDLHYATTRIINHHKNEDDVEELTWPQEPVITASPAPSHGIKKFVRNSLKLFITQPPHKRPGK